MIIGYVRVSTDDQRLDLQKDELRKAGCEKIFEDHGFSGADANRPGFNELIKSLQEGDTLVVWKLDRLGRDIKQLILIIDELGKRRIQFKSLNDGIDTHNTMGKALFYFMAIFADLERTNIRERTNAGLAAARRRGIILGRPKKLSPERFDMAVRLLKEEGKGVSEVARIMQTTRQTIYSEIKRRKKL